MDSLFPRRQVKYTELRSDVTRNSLGFVNVNTENWKLLLWIKVMT